MFPDLRVATLLLLLVSSFATADDRLTRLATLPDGAEATGLFLSAEGDLFLNAQHPRGMAAPVGVVTGIDFRALPKRFEPVTAEGGRQVRVAVGDYQVLGRAGETLEGALPTGFGTLLDAEGRPLERSNSPDFNGFVPTGPGEGFLFTAWEDRPGGMDRLRIRKQGEGRWRVMGADKVDFSGVDGTWNNCFGTVSPWGTPLSSEELYVDDTAEWNAPGTPAKPLVRYLGGERFPNPYDYGYIVEIADPRGTPRPIKRWALGRFSHENAVVMPDRRTVYLSDDGEDTVFFKFIADRPGDLSAGTLYAARALQDRGSDPAETGFTLQWLALGHADERSIGRWIADYDRIGPDDYRKGENSYLSDAEIAAWAADWGDNGRLDTVADARAAFLESRKAARTLGATAEWSKMEGVNIHFAGAADGSVPYLFLAMSRIEDGMSDSSGDVRLDSNPCGVVYRLPLEPDYNVSRMEPAVAGGPYHLLTFGDRCPSDQIAGPDNLVVMPDGRLIIGEDTPYHANNMVWVWQPSKANDD